MFTEIHVMRIHIDADTINVNNLKIVRVPAECAFVKSIPKPSRQDDLVQAFAPTERIIPYLPDGIRNFYASEASATVEGSGGYVCHAVKNDNIGY